MKILITNDDGIFAEGIKLLVEKAKKYGTVVVVAPKTNQSATSHKINIKTGFTVEALDIFPGIKAYAVDSTPADCIRFAVYQLKLDFDIVFSGINNGYNLGFDMLYSGTVAGAVEANYHKKKSLAFSVDFFKFKSAEQYFDDVMDYIFQNRLLDFNDMYNVNFVENAKGIKMTKQGDPHFATYFLEKEGLYYQKGNAQHHLDHFDKDRDVSAIVDGYISITPILSDRTNFEVFEKVKK